MTLATALAPEVTRTLAKVNVKATENDVLRLACEDLVIRARAGEQIAAAILMNVGKNAAKGNARAVKSKKVIEQVIADLPISTLGVVPGLKRENLPVEKFANVVVGGEGPDQYGAEMRKLLPHMGMRGIVMLANGPHLHKTGRARAIAVAYENPLERHAFCLSRRHAGCRDDRARLRLHPRVQHAMMMGESFGMAQKIQAVRLPNSKISDFDPATGWELGE